MKVQVVIKKSNGTDLPNQDYYVGPGEHVIKQLRRYFK